MFCFSSHRQVTSLPLHYFCPVQSKCWTHVHKDFFDGRHYLRKLISIYLSSLTCFANSIHASVQRSISSSLRFLVIWAGKSSEIWPKPLLMTTSLVGVRISRTRLNTWAALFVAEVMVATIFSLVGLLLQTQLGFISTKNKIVPFFWNERIITLLNFPPKNSYGLGPVLDARRIAFFIETSVGSKKLAGPSAPHVNDGSCCQLVYVCTVMRPDSVKTVCHLSVTVRVSFRSNIDPCYHITHT